MPNPLFSVIIPTFNRAEKLVRAIRSVTAQTVRDYEIIVIDDGADGTREMLDQFGSAVRYLRGGGIGVAAARNIGIKEARGSYIAFLDADDFWYPSKLALVENALKANPATGLFYSRIDYVAQTGERLSRPRIRCIRGRGYVELLGGDFIANSATVVKKECLDRVGGFDTGLHGCEDWDLWIRIARYYPLWCITEVLVAYEYLAPDSLSAEQALVLKGIDEVNVKSLQADPELSPAQRRQISSSVAYVRGRVCLGSRNRAQALAEFRQAVSLDRGNWRAWIYVILLGRPAMQKWVPAQLREMLRLPDVS
jgi:glycosyltransferase involved in cell wall biosynthesis